MPFILKPSEIMHRTETVNAISAIPVIGQIIGVATMASNVVKSAIDVFRYIGVSASAAINRNRKADNAEFWNEIDVKKTYIRSNLIYHLKFVGIGLTRFILPVIGGLTLWSAKVNPVRTYQIENVEGHLKIDSVWKKFKITQDRPKAPYKVLAIPVIGQVTAVGMILYNGGSFVFNSAKIAALAIYRKFSNVADQPAIDRMMDRTIVEIKDDAEMIGISFVSGALPVVGAMVLMSAGIHESRADDVSQESLIEHDSDLEASVKLAGRLKEAEQFRFQETLFTKNFDNVIPGLDRNLKTVAMILGDTQLLGSEWEGGDAAEATAFCRQVFNNTEGAEELLGVCARAAIEEDYNNVENISAMFNDKEPKQIAEYIREQLQKRGRCLIPIKTKIRKSGHVSAAVLQKGKNGKIEIYHLNVGEGADEFPVLKIEHKVQRSFRSNRRLLAPGMFTGENPAEDERIAGLIKNIAIVDPTQEGASWNTKLLQSITNMISTPTDDVIPVTHAVTKQRSGTCSIQLERLIRRDHLIHLDKNKEAPEQQLLRFKRSNLKIKFEALKLVKKQLQTDNIPYLLARSLIYAASHTFAQSFKQGTVTREEAEILGALIKDSMDVLATKSETGVNCPVITSTEKLTNIPCREIKPEEPPREWRLRSEPSPPTFPHQIPSTGIRSFEEYKKIVSLPHDFFNIISVVRAFPIPSIDPTNKTLYDDLNEEQAKDLLRWIAFAGSQMTLVKEMSTGGEVEGDNLSKGAEEVAVQLHLAAIANALIPKIPSLKAKGCTLQILNEGCLREAAIQMGDEAKRLQQLVSYFANQKDGKNLFGFLERSGFDVMKFFEKPEKKQDADLKVIHDYLGQFVDTETQEQTIENYKARFILSQLGDLSNDEDIEKDLLRFAQQRKSASRKIDPHLFALRRTCVQIKLSMNKESRERYLLDFKAFCLSSAPETYVKLRDNAEKIEKGLERSWTTLTIENKESSEFLDLCSVAVRLTQVLSSNLESLRDLYDKQSTFTLNLDEVSVEEPIVEYNPVPSASRNSPLLFNPGGMDFEGVSFIKPTPRRKGLLFNPGVQASNENEAMNLGYRNLTIGEDEEKDMLRMEISPQTSIGQLISWINLHPNKKSELLFKWVERLFTQEVKNSYVNSVQNEPVQRSNFQEMILNRIEPLLLQDAEEICFWTRLAFWCETRVDQFPGMKIDGDFLNKIKQVIIKKIESYDPQSLSDEEKKLVANLYIHLAYLEVYPQPQSAQQTEEYLRYLFCANFFDQNNIASLNFKGSPVSFRTILDFKIRSATCENHLEAFFKNPENQQTLNRLGSSFLKLIGVNVAMQWSSPGWPVLTAKHGANTYLINIKEGVLLINEFSVTTAQLDYQTVQKAEALGIDTSKPVIQSDDVFRAVDGSFEIITRRWRNPIFRRCFDFHPDVLFTLEDTSNRTIPTLTKENSLWIGDGVQYVVNKEGKKICCGQPGTGYYKEVAGKRVFAREIYEMDQEIRAFWEKFHNFEQIIFWGNENGLAQIEMPLLNGLKFNVIRDDDGEVYLECEQHKGYVLSKKQGMLGNVRMDGVLRLEHRSDPSKQRIIMPAQKVIQGHPLNPAGKESSREFAVQDTPLSAAGYFDYEVNSTDESLYTPDAAGALFLSYVHQSRGEFALARFYLDRVPQGEGDADAIGKILDSMGLVKIKSPQAVAFFLHVALRIIREGWSVTEAFRSRIGEVSRNYHEYSHLNQDGLPESLLIPSADLDLIWNAAKIPDPLMQGNVVVPNTPIIESVEIEKDDRVNFYINFEGIVEDPPLFSLGSKPEKIDDEDNEPRSLTLGSYLNKHFKGLFFKALRSNATIKMDAARLQEMTRRNQTIQDSFDAELEYLMHCAGPNQDANKNLIKLLYIVRHRSELFAGITLGNELSDDEKSKEIEQIKKAYQDGIASYQAKSRYNSGKEQPVVTAPQSVLVRDAQRVEMVPSGQIYAVESGIKPILERFYIKKEQYVFDQASPFAIKQTSKNPIVGRLQSKLQDAFDTKLVRKTYSEYALRPDASVWDLKKEVLSRLKDITHDASKLRSRISKLANEHDPEKMSNEQRSRYYLYQLEKGKKGIQPITVEDVLLAAGTRGANNLLGKNPFLTTDELTELNDLAVKLMILSSEQTQVKEAKGLIDSDKQANIRQAGLILAKTRCFDPYKWPELVFYEYASGIMLREVPDQAKLLIDLFTLLFKENKTSEDQAEIRRISFEFQAGGGKTKIISVILAAKALAKGKVPVFFSLPPLVDVVRKDLREMLVKVFNKGTQKIHLQMGTEVTPQMIDRFRFMLSQSVSKGICIVLTPQTYHAINLALQKALRVESLGGGTVANRKLIDAIMAFKKDLKDNAIFIVDEAHHNVDALLEANLALGNMSQLPERERNLIGLAYKMMTGNTEVPLVLKDGRLVADVLQIRHNRQAQVDEGDLNLALDAISDALIDSIQFKMQSDKNEIKKYVKDPKASPSREVLFSSERDIIGLIRGLRTQILPHNLRQVGQMDYGKAIDPKNPVATPRSQKNASDSSFENPYISCALTCQMVYQEGITIESQFATCLKILILSERKLKTKISKQFYDFQTKNKKPLGSINLSDLDDPRKVKRLMAEVGRFPPLLNIYLNTYALQQIKVYPEKMTSTGADMIAAAWASVQFSATLGERVLYPYASEASPFWSDPEFLADVTQRLCFAHNRNVHYQTPSTPAALLDELYAKSPQELDHLEGLIDLGYWSKGSSSGDWAKAFNQFAAKTGKDYAGSLYFEEDNKGEKQLYFLPIDEKVPVRLLTTNLKVELPKIGVSPNKVFKIYAPDETTGTDLQISPNAKMMITVGENTTLSDAAQAVLRMRQFLDNPIDPTNSQSTLVVAPEKQRESIAKASKEDRMEDLVVWMMENEAAKLKETIIANARQDIEFLARHFVMDGSKTSQELIERYRENKRALCLSTKSTPYSMYGQPMVPEEIAKFLTSYATEFYYSASIPRDVMAKFMDQVKLIIGRAQEYVKFVETNQQALSGTAKQEVQAFQVQSQQQEQLQQQNVEQKLKVQQKLQSDDYNRNLTLPPDSYADEGETSSLKNINNRTDIIPINSETFQFPNPPANLFLAPNVKRVDFYTNYQKTADFLLVLDENGKRTYIACSNYDAEQWTKQLAKGHVRPGLKACLYGLDGKIIQNGKKDALLPPLQDEASFRDILTYCNLLNGVISDEEALKKRIGNDVNDYRKAWIERKNVHKDGGVRFNDLDFERLVEAKDVV